MNLANKKALSLAGGVLSAVAFAWVAYIAYEQRSSLADISFPFGTAALFAIIYALSLLLLAWNWADLASHLENSSGAPRILLCSSFLKSQAWKYLPGNVFHYVGRHVAGVQGGATSAALLMATIAESVALVAAALLVSAGGLLLSDVPLIGPWRVSLGSFAAALAFLVVLSPLVLCRLTQRNLPIGSWLLVLGRGVLFMAGLGGIACLVLGEPSNAGAIVGATTLAWVVGFLMPGSPGGIGTREAALIVLLGPVLGEPTVLAASLVLRAITVAGDLLASVFGLLIERRLSVR